MDSLILASKRCYLKWDLPHICSSVSFDARVSYPFLDSNDPSCMLGLSCSYLWGNIQLGTRCKECRCPYYLTDCINQKSVRRVGCRVAFAQRFLDTLIPVVGSNVLVSPQFNKH